MRLGTDRTAFTRDHLVASPTSDAAAQVAATPRISSRVEGFDLLRVPGVRPLILWWAFRTFSRPRCWRPSWRSRRSPGASMRPPTSIRSFTPRRT